MRRSSRAAIWIAWEDHRRSRELAEEFDAEYFPIVVTGNRFKRYPISIFLTIKLLLFRRPRLVFCQNPSLVLNALCILASHVFRFRVVADRHSNFKFETYSSKNIKWVVFRYLSRYTIKNSHFVIVTNSYLKEYCESLGGVAGVLPDKLPSLPQFQECENCSISSQIDPNKKIVMCITMFDDDEPISHLVESSKYLAEANLYFTGNYKKVYSEADRIDSGKNGAVMLGFVSDEQYLQLLRNCDLVLVLTIKDYILNCGAYEAVAANKRVLLADTPTLRSYFSGVAAGFADPTDPVDIARQINLCLSQGLKSDFYFEKDRLHEKWLLNKREIDAKISDIR